MSISAIGSTGRGSTVYGLSSPYLNGVRRKSDGDTAAAARLQAIAASTRTRATAATPFANPAIALIAQQAAMSAMLTAPGDVSVLEQSFVAAALLTGATSPLASVVQIGPATPAIPPVAALARAAKPA